MLKVRTVILLLAVVVLAYVFVPAKALHKIIGAPVPQKLALKKPKVEWVACSCGEGVIGLTSQDHMLYSAYLSGLEHELRQCQKQ